MELLRRIILAVIVAVAVGLVVIFVGIVLSSLNVPPAEAVGGFLKNYGWVIGVLAGLWYFFSGGWPTVNPPG